MPSAAYCNVMQSRSAIALSQRKVAAFAFIKLCGKLITKLAQSPTLLTRGEESPKCFRIIRKHFGLGLTASCTSHVILILLNKIHICQADNFVGILLTSLLSSSGISFSSRLRSKRSLCNSVLIISNRSTGHNLA